jgi:hypothetical protein
MEIHRKPLLSIAIAALLSSCGSAPQGGDSGSATSTPTGGLAQSADDGIQLIRDTSIGEKYGAPGPRSCAPKNLPASGPPSPSQVAKYVICGGEHESDELLYLDDQITITDIGKPEPYDGTEGTDPNKPVYAIKGTLLHYSCHHIVKPGGPIDMGPDYAVGSNCTVDTETAATGKCHTDTFGNWSCGLADPDAIMKGQKGVAPPAAGD